MILDARDRQSSHALRSRRPFGQLSGLTLGRAFAPVLLAALGGLAACASGRGVDTGVVCLQFQDMVVPEGFRLHDDAHQSHSREEGEWRMGHFVYSGLPPIAEAASYVRQRMPQHSWVLEVDEMSEATKGHLKFVRGRYLADYTFQRLEGTTQMVVEYQTDYTRR